MKKTRSRFILPVLFFAIILGCEPPIVFTEPQPAGRREAAAFDEHYRGVYFCEEDSTILHITDRRLIKSQDYAFSVHRDTLAREPGVELKGNQLYVAELDQTIPVTIEDDLVSGVINLSDTLFEVGPEQVLKSYRGHQVLNRKLREAQWEVHLITQSEDGSISFYKTVLPDELAELEAITPVRDLSTDEQKRYQISPSRRAFRKLMKSKLIFGGCEHFRRLP